MSPVQVSSILHGRGGESVFTAMGVAAVAWMVYDTLINIDNEVRRCLDNIALNVDRRELYRSSTCGREYSLRYAENPLHHILSTGQSNLWI